MNNRTTKLIVTLQTLFASLYIGIGYCLAQENTPSKITLSGEIGHATSLKPIEPMLQAGSKFDQRLLNRFVPQDYWYQIPSWLGGIWQRNEQNLLKQKSLTLSAKIKSTLYPPRLGKFKSQVKYRWGYQYDRLGNIWNYAKFPYIVKVDGANTYTIQVVREATPLSVSDKVVTLKFRSTSHKVDARTNIILFAEQAEAISMFAKYEPNSLYVRYSRKVFDSSGKPRSIQESESFIPRVSKFFPLNTVNGKDLRVSLRNYLLAKQPNLAPQIVSPQQFIPQQRFPVNQIRQPYQMVPQQNYARPVPRQVPMPYYYPPPARKAKPIEKKQSPVPHSHQPPVVILEDQKSTSKKEAKTAD